MIRPGLRLTRRAEWISDIIFEPNNSGIVLNVSEGGLCFHSVISSNGKARCVYVGTANQRIEAAGEVAWMDETGKQVAYDSRMCHQRFARKSAGW